MAQGGRSDGGGAGRVADDPLLYNISQPPRGLYNGTFSPISAGGCGGTSVRGRPRGSAVRRRVQSFAKRHLDQEEHFMRVILFPDELPLMPLSALRGSSGKDFADRPYEKLRGNRFLYGP